MISIEVRFIEGGVKVTPVVKNLEDVARGSHDEYKSLYFDTQEQNLLDELLSPEAESRSEPILASSNSDSKLEPEIASDSDSKLEPEVALDSDIKSEPDSVSNPDLEQDIQSEPDRVSNPEREIGNLGFDFEVAASFPKGNLHALCTLIERFLSDNSFKKSLMGNTNLYSAVYQLLHNESTPEGIADLTDTLGNTVVEELSEKQRELCATLLPLIFAAKGMDLPRYLIDKNSTWNKPVATLILENFQALCNKEETKLPQPSAMEGLIVGETISALKAYKRDPDINIDMNVLAICEGWIHYRSKLSEKFQDNRIVLRGQTVIANIVANTVTALNGKEHRSDEETTNLDTLKMLGKMLSSSPTQFFLCRQFYFLYKDLAAKNKNSLKEDKDYVALKYFLQITDENLVPAQLSFDGERFYTSRIIPDNIKYSAKIRKVLEKSGIVQNKTDVQKGTRIRLPLGNAFTSGQLNTLRDFLNNKTQKIAEDLMGEISPNLALAIQDFIPKKTGIDLLPFLPLFSKIAHKINLDELHGHSANALFKLPPRHFALCWDLLRLPENYQNYKRARVHRLFNTKDLTPDEINQVNSLRGALIDLALKNEKSDTLENALGSENYRIYLWVMNKKVEPLRIIIKNSGLFERFVPLSFRKKKEEGASSDGGSKTSLVSPENGLVSPENGLVSDSVLSEKNPDRHALLEDRDIIVLQPPVVPQPRLSDNVKKEIDQKVKDTIKKASTQPRDKRNLVNTENVSDSVDPAGVAVHRTFSI